MIFETAFESILANWHLILLFFTAAILYSSVGFGGGSSYLAILALAGIAFTQIRATALLCNIVVVFGNVLLFYEQKNIPWKKVVPIVLWSVPLAYLGGKLSINKTLFFILFNPARCIPSFPNSGGFFFQHPVAVGCIKFSLSTRSCAGSNGIPS